jgi:hypothetical protein
LTLHLRRHQLRFVKRPTHRYPKFPSVLMSGEAGSRG